MAPGYGYARNAWRAAAFTDRPKFLTWPHIEEDGLLCLLADSKAAGYKHPAEIVGEILGDAYKGTERLYQADRTLCQKISLRHRQSGRSHSWRKSGAPRICEANQLKDILVQSLASNEPTSAHRIAAHLGYANDGYIQLKFPDLCRAIGKKIAKANQRRREATHRALECALQEDPAPTLAQLSRCLGYSSSSVLRANELALCDQLANRYKEHQAKRRADLEMATAAALERSRCRASAELLRQGRMYSFRKTVRCPNTAPQLY